MEDLMVVLQIFNSDEDRELNWEGEYDIATDHLGRRGVSTLPLCHSGSSFFYLTLIEW
jgi:hypothetical protein